jgi:hypothetical protein
MIWVLPPGPSSAFLNCHPNSGEWSSGGSPFRQIPEFRKVPGVPEWMLWEPGFPHVRLRTKINTKKNKK